ncbi:hypothetical protein [uncultured Corynebacterium sp.]|uniref:hypothetical protein n=1 Tax=uncultured Corynebacterium sp. TaxID=159447 RepID=UPI0025D57238|nr:hypothetical protein [uncultured Corynebacterium sp.]
MFSSRVAGAALSAALVFPAVAHAQLPPEVEAAIAAPISVPAGQTTTVSLPVPAEASYSGDGWNVSASGTSATITAPAEGGQISVPVSAQGMNATLTLVADGSVSQGDIQDEIDGAEGASAPAPGPAPDKPAEGGNAPADKGAEGGAEKHAPAKGKESLPVVPGEKPERKPAGEANLEGAEYVNLESHIEGNTITAKMGLKQAYDLYQQFKDTEENDVKLRYLDGEGNIIQGVKRDVDASSRTLTLTYPEGEAPDNPFIMQLLRNDGSGAALIVTLQDPNYQSASEHLDKRQQEEPKDENEGSHLGWIIGGAAAAVLIVLVALVVALKRRSSQR